MGGHVRWREIVVSVAERAIHKSSVHLDPASLVSIEEELPIAGLDNGSNLFFLSSNRKVGVTRPDFHVSPSGRYIAVHWIDNGNYIILEMNLESSMVEAERGVCWSFAWVGLDDHFIIQTPSIERTLSGDRDPPENRRMSFRFTKKSEVKRSRESPKLVLKRGREDPRVVDGLEGTLVDTFDGLLLCCNYTGGSEEEKSLHRSRFLALMTGAEGNELRPVGPVMKPVSAVSWDYTSGHCAVLIEGTINILILTEASRDNDDKMASKDSRIVGASKNKASKHVSGRESSISSVNAKYSLTTLHSIQISSFPGDMTMSMTWRRACLFVMTMKSFVMIRSENSSSMVHVVSIMSNQSTSFRQIIQMIGIIRNSLVLASVEKNDVEKMIEWSDCPRALIHYLFSCEDGTGDFLRASKEWAQTLPAGDQLEMFQMVV